MARIRHALIMAAGRGLRMMPLTAVIPKPMAPYEGSTLIAKGIARIRRYVDHVHITVGYKGNVLAEHVIAEGVSSVLNTEGQGNAWWISHTLVRHLDEPVAVLTCDNVVDLDFDLLAHDYEELGSPACMVVPVTPVPGLRGDYIFHERQRVTALERDRVAPTYCSGIQVLNPRKVIALAGEADDFYAVWRSLIAAEQLYCARVYPKQWTAVDTLEQLESLRSSSDTSARD
jgi:NDP-sugar pyrophosphorylase family protein